jgi:uncharacterized protein DUF1501
LTANDPQAGRSCDCSDLRAFLGLLAAHAHLKLGSGGIQGGRTYGESDKDTQSIKTERIGVADFNATIAYALGLPLTQEFISPSRRPFKVAHDGTPVKELF